MEPRNDGKAVGDSSGCTAGQSSTAATCRLCWDEEGPLPDGMLLSPCKCAGSSAYIHRGCLQTWLNTRPRSQCDICRSPYDTALLADAGVSIPPPRPDYYLSEARMRQDFAAARAAWWQQLAGQRPGGGGNGALWAPPGGAANPAARDALWWWWAPRRRRWWVRDPWQDSLFWSGLLHGAWRVIIAIDGVAATLKLMRTRRAPAGGALPWPFGGRHSAAAAARVAAAARAGRRRGAAPPSAAEEVRASFNGTTVWQVQLYSAIIALTTTSTAADAASGMALGAIIGGCLSSLVFLPLVGLSKLSALRGTLRLAATAGVRLAAGLACRPAGYRRLAGALARLGGPVGWVAGRAGAAVAWGVDAVRSRLPPPPPPPGAAPQPVAQQPPQQQRQRPGRQQPQQAQQQQQQQQQAPPRGFAGQWPQQRAAAW